jgi:hypothetical protein
MAGVGKYSRIMLVDDNPMDNLVNSKLIESAGFAKSIKVF